MGIAINSVPEAVPVGQAAIGIFDRLEIMGQYELYSALAGVRIGLLSSADNGIALALQLGGGMASIGSSLDAFSGDDTTMDPALLGGLVVGRRFGLHDIYISYRGLAVDTEILGVQGIYLLNSVKAGGRLFAGRHLFLGIEGGATFHHDFFVVGEGTGTFGITF